MNKKKILKILTKKNIDYLLLSSNSPGELNNYSKDLDLYIPYQNKIIFENLIYKSGFYKRNEKIYGYKKRYFYINPFDTKRYFLDVYYNATFRYNFFYTLKYKFLDEAIKNRFYNKGIFFTKKKYFSTIKILKKYNENKNHKQLFKIKNCYEKKLDINTNNKFFGRSNCILFLGSDGVGKTTQINFFQKKTFFKTFICSFGLSEKSWALNFNLLLFKKLSKYPKIKNLILIFDLIIRKIKLLRYLPNRLILIDRFPGYLLLQRNLYYYFLKILLPSPDLIVVVHASNKIRKKRKPLEIKNDQHKWIKIAKKLKYNYIVVNTSNKSISKINNLISKKFLKNKKNFINLYKN